MNKVPVEDRLDIQELVARYAFRCDTKQYEQIAELFTEDGEFDETVAGLPLCRDRAAIETLFGGVGDMIGFLIHINSNHQIVSYSGDTASGTCHLLAEARLNGALVRILGYYADDYAKVDGQWQFRRRKLVCIGPLSGF